jgi:hypothetical protein
MSTAANMLAVRFQIDRQPTLEALINALPTIPEAEVIEAYDRIKITRWENARERNARALAPTARHR